jgi:HAD superfamily hydrolase (TIGR01490 family)
VTVPIEGTKAAAFFDLDNTLLHGASLFLIGRGMYARGVVSSGDVLRGAWQQLVFRLVGERHGHVSAVRDRGLALGAGVEVAPLVAIGEEIFDELIADRILAETLALAQAHLDLGEDVFIVTAAPVELARIVARRLGLTGALGTVSEVEDGRWTGRLVGDLLHGPAKAQAVTQLAARSGYELTRCAAYSDSINDLPLLSAVGNPHVVNPDRKLRAHADAYGWPVHDFRTARRRLLLVSALAGATVGAGAVAVVAMRRRQDPPVGRTDRLSRWFAFGLGLRAGMLRGTRAAAQAVHARAGIRRSVLPAAVDPRTWRRAA